MNNYYAYGIRNSFGMAFDPITGNLWDTENGPTFGDEINLAKPGFNSGSHVVEGIGKYKKNFNPDDDLVSIGTIHKEGKYSDPEFEWNQTVGPTAIKFLKSDKFGKEYENDMFVGDIHNGNIYHFDLNKNRNILSLSGPLKDKIANTPKELKGIIFGKGFGGITDIQVGPDGYIYVAAITQFRKDNQGTIYRIIPAG